MYCTKDWLLFDCFQCLAMEGIFLKAWYGNLFLATVLGWGNKVIYLYTLWVSFSGVLRV